MSEVSLNFPEFVTNAMGTIVEVRFENNGDIYKKVFNTIDTTMNRKLNEFSNESEYVYIAYVKGMLMFDSLNEFLGREKLIKALQYYFEENKFNIATPDNLLDAFEKSTGTNLDNFFDSWINGKVQIHAMN